jgi:flagellar FliL protein
MSAAAATADAPAPKTGKKKLLIIVGAALLVLLLGGGGAAFMVMKSKAAAAAAEEGEDGEHAAKAKDDKGGKKADPKAVPVFSQLEMFTVNLADRQSERYAQVGITLEVDGAETDTRIKAFMPAVRNQILLAIGDRTAEEIATREGKAALALRIKLDTSRVLGAEFDEADFAPAAAQDPAADETSDEKPAKKKAKTAKKPAVPELPIVAVHFSNFIIQ